ncbi:hypothetical protein SNEBB_005014 [Seison nebaliae]|nr:hypothetical protein SNEBB_005014 [Seison nebaliae]
MNRVDEWKERKVELLKEKKDVENELREMCKECEKMFNGKLEEIKGFDHRLQNVERIGRDMNKKLKETNRLASQVSETMRKLDFTKQNADSLHKRVSQRLKKEECFDGVTDALNRKDFEKAAELVSTNPSDDDDIDVTDCQQLKKVQDVLLNELRKNIEKMNMEEVDRFIILLPRISLEREGIEIYSKFIVEQLKNRIGFLRESDSIIQIKLRSIFESLADTIESRRLVLQKFYSRTSLFIFICQIHDAICNEMTISLLLAWMESQPKMMQKDKIEENLQIYSSIISSYHLYRTFLKKTFKEATFSKESLFIQRYLNGISFKDNSISNEEIDEELVGEIVLKRFKLSEVYHSINASYIHMVEMNLQIMLNKIYSTDSLIQCQVNDQNSINIYSSCDEIFYIIQTYFQLAISTASIDVSCSLCQHLNSLMSGNYLKYTQKCFDKYSSFSFDHNNFVENKEKENKNEQKFICYLARLNTISIICRNSQKLFSDFNQQINNLAIRHELTENQIQMLQSCVYELCKSSAEKFEEIGETRLNHYTTNNVRSLLRKCVQDQFKKTFYNLTIQDPIPDDSVLLDCICQFDVIIKENSQILFEEYLNKLIIWMAKEITQLIEKTIIKFTFTKFGATIFDKQVRRILHFFTNRMNWSIREKLFRLSGISTLLLMESPHELCDCIELLIPSSTIGRFSKKDVENIMKLRSDFSIDEIRRTVDKYGSSL